jgi:hypothetical protein
MQDVTFLRYRHLSDYATAHTGHVGAVDSICFCYYSRCLGTPRVAV